MTKPKTNRVEMPSAMRALAQQKWAVCQAAQLAFSSYAEGCMQGMGLKGDWGLDTGTWAFTKPPEKEAT